MYRNVSIRNRGVSTGEKFSLPHGRITCTAKSSLFRMRLPGVRSSIRWLYLSTTASLTFRAGLRALFVVSSVGCRVREGRRRDTGLSLRDLSFSPVVHRGSAAEPTVISGEGHRPGRCRPRCTVLKLAEAAYVLDRLVFAAVNRYK